MENLQVDRFISEYWITSCVVNNCRHFVLGIIYMKYMFNSGYGSGQTKPAIYIEEAV